MKRFISLLFVFIMLFSVSVNAIVPHSTVEEVGLVNDVEIIETVDVCVYEYYYKNEKTFEILESALIEYNKEFGYETEKEIRIGNGRKELEFTAAIFDEEKIIIYCKDIEESIVEESVKRNNINCFIEFFSNVDLYEEIFDDFNFFTSDLMKHNSYLGSIVIVASLGYYNKMGSSSSYKVYKMVKPIMVIADIILSSFSIGYLIYMIICIIRYKVKKKGIKKIKIKIILSLLSFFYILFGGLYGIISWILSMATLI